MAIIKFKRGLDADIPTLELAEPGWAIDTNTLYMGGSAGNQAIAGGGGGMTAHEMTGAYHTASGLSAGCVVRATGATTFVWSKLQHSDLDGVTANQHHNQEHGITSASDHTIGGSAYDLVGLTANSTLGLLKPTYRPDGAEVILKSNSSGWIWPTRLGVGAASPVSHQAFGARLEYTDLATAPTGGYFSVTLVPVAPVSYTNPFGLFSGIYNDSVENVGDVTGIESDVINSTTGSMGTAVGVVGKISNDGGISSAIALLASAIVNNNSMAAAYGVRVYDQDQAAVNYAIHTGVGLNSLGDNLQFRQAATVSTTAGNLTLDAAGGGIQLQDYVGVNITPTALADIRTTRTATNENSLNASIWTTLTASPANAPAAGTTYRGMLLQTQTAGSVSMTNVTAYGFLGQVIHGNTNTLANSVGVNIGTFLTSSGSITNAYGLQVSGAQNSGGGDIGTEYGINIGAITAGNTNYAIYTNSGLVSLGDNLQFRQAATISTTTGDLTLQPTSGNVKLPGTGELLVVGNGTGEGNIVFNGASGSVRDLRFQSGGVNRWLLRVNSSAESGANVGSDFELYARADGGGALFLPLTIQRSTGNMGVNVNATATGAQLSVAQSSTTGARATVDLNQADLSEEFINFISTIGAGNPIDTAAIGTYYGKVRVAVNGTFKFLALYNS